MGHRLQRLAPGGLVRLLLVRQLLRIVSARFPVGLEEWKSAQEVLRASEWCAVLTRKGGLC